MPSKELLAARLVEQRALVKTLETVEKFIREYNADRDAFQVPVRIDTLDRINRSFLQVQDEVERSDVLEKLELHLTERVEFEQRYCIAKGFLLTRKPAENQSQNTSMATASGTAQLFSSAFHLRLPKIDLPKFDGDFSRWLSFRDTFMSMVHSNGDIPTVVKLQYLLQSLEGEAKKPFESVDIEADNYSTTWDALLKRYDNRRYLKRQLFRALYDLPPIKQECSKQIHTLVDDFQRHVRALEKLGEPVQQWDTPLVNMLSYKLDQSTLRAWEEKTSEQEDVTYAEMAEFLYQRVRILNSIGYESQKPTAVKVAGSPQTNFKSRITANAASSTSIKSSCPLSCSDSHSLRECPAFLEKDVSQRRQLVSQLHLCWNCLSFGHQVRKCGSKYSCRTCHDKHHSLLHDPASSMVSSNQAVSSASSVQQPLQSTSSYVESSGSPTPPHVSMTAQTSCSTGLLETVVLNVVDDRGKVHVARALLDSASMSNFISGNLAKTLVNLRSEVDISIAGIGLSTQKARSAITTTIQSRDQAFSTKLQFLILEQPSAGLPTVPIDVSAWDLPNVALADPQFHVPGRIDLVIGSDSFWEFHTGRKVSLGAGLPWIAETPFGWAISGSATNSAISNSQTGSLSTADEHLQAPLRRLREVETTPSGPAHTTEENHMHELHDSTTISDPYDRNVVHLPRVEHPEVVLGSSGQIAECRSLSLERRLQRDPAIKDSHHGIENGKQASNDQEVREDVPSEDLAIVPLHVRQDEQTVVTHGFVWEPKSYKLRFKVQLPLTAAVLTKRDQLSRIAHVSNPLGIVGLVAPKYKISSIHARPAVARLEVCAPPLTKQLFQKFNITLKLGTTAGKVFHRLRAPPSRRKKFSASWVVIDHNNSWKESTVIGPTTSFAQNDCSDHRFIKLRCVTLPYIVYLGKAALRRSNRRRVVRFKLHLGHSLVTSFNNVYRGTKLSRLKWLNPFVDADGILRVGGRLLTTGVFEAIKHPALRSAKHSLFALLANHFKLLHAGRQFLLATLRQKHHILGDRFLTKSVYHCHTCPHSKPTLVQQGTADAPESRVAPKRPGSVCESTFNNLPPANRPLGKIVKLHSGKPGVIREPAIRNAATKKPHRKPPESCLRVSNQPSTVVTKIQVEQPFVGELARCAPALGTGNCKSNRFSFNRSIYLVLFCFSVAARIQRYDKSIRFKVPCSSTHNQSTPTVQSSRIGTPTIRCRDRIHVKVRRFAA